MINYQVGLKLDSVCAHCKTSVRATFTSVTLSLSEGLEEVENVLVLICDECGNMTGIPARSLPPIQHAMKRLVESGVVTDRSDIPVELKSKVNAKKTRDKKSEPNHQHEYPMQATG